MFVLLSDTTKVFFFSIFIEKLKQYPETRSARRICGILGTVNLINGLYLIVATHRIFVGIINGQIIWRLAGYDIIPYIPSALHLNDIQVIPDDIQMSTISLKLYIDFRKNKMNIIWQCFEQHWTHRFSIFRIHMI